MGNSGALDQAIEVPQAFGVQSVDEKELRHAFVGRLMGRPHVKHALEALPGARKVLREPGVFGVVHTYWAQWSASCRRVLSARLRASRRCALARCFDSRLTVGDYTCRRQDRETAKPGGLGARHDAVGAMRNDLSGRDRG